MSNIKLRNELYTTVIVLGISIFLALYWGLLMTLEVLITWQSDRLQALEQFLFLLIGAGLLYGSIIYLLMRAGRLRRDLRVRYPREDALNHFYSHRERRTPSLAVLIPSYKEEPKVVEMTLWSAALLEYPHKHVTLLLDDPVEKEMSESFRETLLIAERTEAEFAALHAKTVEAERKYRERTHAAFDPGAERLELARFFEELAAWFDRKFDAFYSADHAEHFFENAVLGAGAARMRAIEGEVLAMPEATYTRLAPYYRRARSLFNVSVRVFQRKKYENLSHEPNKAMNLNSYIGLLGGSYREEKRGDGLWLVSDPDGPLRVPAVEYLITLDADSILMYDYAKRLIHFMEQRKNRRVAVAQTPYNTFRCPEVNIERIAGATTDIQHLIHQGFEFYHASFWVGANALLRTRALRDIREEDTERGHTIYRFVQDRTVIEDTESSIDMVQKGWRVYNYRATLAFSATPPDFGSLIIQRQRWANGGLIIFPKLVYYFFTARFRLLRRTAEAFVRSHYLLSIAMVNIGLVTMIFYPFDGKLHITPLVLSAAIYFSMYARDLRQLGYRGMDLLRVYALNLLLIPINLKGVFISIRQLITKQKIPFGRTPKVQNRTTATPFIIAFEFGITAFLLLAFVWDIMLERYEHAVFSIINGLFFLYAVTYFITWRHGWEDLRLALRRFRERRRKPRTREA